MVGGDDLGILSHSLFSVLTDVLKFCPVTESLDPGYIATVLVIPAGEC